MKDERRTREERWPARQPPADFADRVMARLAREERWPARQPPADFAEAVMARRTLEERWPARRPPADFAERVTARLAREERRRRAWRVAVVGAAALALTFGGGAWLATRSRGPSESSIVAERRVDLDVAPGVRATVSPGAIVRWTALGVTQTAGEVSYHAELGRRLRVTTPLGELTTQGSDSRVIVDAPREGGAAVFVAVSVGEVSLRGVVIARGGYAKLDAAGMVTDRDDLDGRVALALGISPRARATPTEPPTESPRVPSSALPPAWSRPTSRSSLAAASPSAPPTPSGSTRPAIVPPCVCSPLQAICDCSP